MTNYPLETKLVAVNEYINGVESIRVIATKYNVSKSMLHRWVAKFQHHGEVAFQESYTIYTIKFKMDVLNYINETGASIEEATAVYNVSSSGLVWKWKHLVETQGIDALKPQIKERSPMKKTSKNNQPVEGSIEALQAEIEQLRMENAYLKKLQALIQEKRKTQNKPKR
jgi:transposase